MVSSSLRRSQRGKLNPFKEGDNVQIVKSKGVLSGVLIRKLDERPSNPVWIVRFDDGTKDQAIPEKSFGRVVPTSSTKSRDRSRSSNSDNSTSVSNSSDGDKKNVALVLLSREGEKQKNSKKKSTKNKKKQQSRAATTVVALSDNMSHSKNGIKSVNTEEEEHQQEAGINTRSSRKGKRNYASLDSIPATPKQPPKKSKKDTKEECVKVQYSTGTLYLYRGEHPRAVFKWNF